MKMDRSELINLALKTPPAEWDSLAQRWLAGTEPSLPGVGYLPDATRDLDAVVERLIRFREYMDQRYGHGCGDQGHSAAVKAQNKLATRIRKVLGFTHPDRGNFTF